MKKWLRIEDNSTVHIVPEDDLIAHEPRNCVCGPKVTEVVSDQTVKWQHVYFSLDGKELLE